MSELTAPPDRGATGTADRMPAWRQRRSLVRPVVLAVLLVVLLALPIYVDEFWLRMGFAVFGAIVGAIGLNLLVGTTGQLSLAHAFFLAMGAITYTFVSGTAGGGTSVRSTVSQSARTMPRYHSRSASRNGTLSTNSCGSLLPKVKPNSENSGTERPLNPPVTGVQVLRTWTPMKTSPSEATPR